MPVTVIVRNIRYPLNTMTDHLITLTHLNVRQSIAILLTKLVIVDLLLAILVVGSYFLIVQAEILVQDVSRNPVLFLITFSGLGITKIILTVYIVLQWLNEYYEITPEAVIHKKGVINRTTERYTLDKIRRITIEDTFLGEMLNFATISLYDLRLNKTLDMYLIHNPDRYAKILKTLKQELETRTDRKMLPFISKREDLVRISE